MRIQRVNMKEIMNLSGSKQQQHIVLVHGLCHGAWCWYKVAALLRSEGHKVTVPDLAASGTDTRRIEEVITFTDYTQPLMEFIASLPPKEKVILVGHSLGGLNIALVAEQFPDKVAAMVFATAFMPNCNNAPSHIMDKYLNQIMKQSSEWMDTQFSDVGETAESPHTSMLFGPQFMASKLYQQCSPEDLTLATILVRPGSLFSEDMRNIPVFSKDRYGSIPCIYIVAHEDVIIPKDFQQWMVQDHQVEIVFEIRGADHMVMLSAPQELFQYLIQVADCVHH